MEKKIIFFGKWGAGYKALEKLLELGYKIEYVCTKYNTDDTDDYENLVYKLAKKNGLQIVKSYKELLDKQLNKNEYIGISILHTEIYNREILNMINIINVHPSLLPNYRGPSPIQWAIKNHEEVIGVTSHYIDENIDGGQRILYEEIKIDYFVDFNDLLETINNTIINVLINTLKGDKNAHNLFQPDVYLPRLNMPKSMYSKKVNDVYNFLSKEKVQVFTGNRADFGILYPLILELSELYRVELIISGTHILEKWNTIEEIKKKLFDKDIIMKIIDLPKTRKHLINGQNHMVYMRSFSEIYDNYILDEIKCKDFDAPRFAVVLGDRIEALGFAISAYALNIPIIHLCGGDIVNAPYFDTHIRHSLSKLAHIHLTTNEESSKVLKQLGEEKWRIKTIGHLALDYDMLGMIPSKEKLIEKYNIKRDKVVITTLHPNHSIDSEENLINFKKVLEAIVETKRVIDFELIVTATNNDPGYEKIFEYITQLKKNGGEGIKVIDNLGTMNYFGLMKHFKTVIVGNSSSGLIETVYFSTPCINIGDRQTDRVRASNVFDLDFSKSMIGDKILDIFKNYTTYVNKFQNERFFFGDGKSSKKAIRFIQETLNSKDKLLVSKKFITL